MSERKELGHIKRADLGWGGYQDAMFGVAWEFAGQAWGCNTFDGGWGMKPSERAQWTEADQMADYAKACVLVRETLVKAKKQRLSQLVGVPVEVTFEGNRLKSWRILDEVLS